MRVLPLCALLLVLATGCGGSTRVQGTVSLDGVPLSDGSISFEPADGAGPSFGAAIANGRFQVPAQTPVTAGTKRVRIRGSIKTGKQVPAGPPHPPSTMTDEVVYYPPVGTKEEVHDAELKAGQVNELRFDLKAAKTGK